VELLLLLLLLLLELAHAEIVLELDVPAFCLSFKFEAAATGVV
jgi:hypothetical protein